jgi:hypothetical protein
MAAAFVGCESEDPRVPALRGKFLLAEEPAGAVGIADSSKDKEPHEVVVVGRVKAGEFDPWAKDQAAFIISEALADDHAHSDDPNHDAANCPFCRRRAERANATALVQFHDENGQLVPIDARKLLGVSQDQVVVVRGTGKVSDLGVLVISATGIHLRR